jgi:hypothetical protein
MYPMLPKNPRSPCRRVERTSLNQSRSARCFDRLSTNGARYREVPMRSRINTDSARAVTACCAAQPFVRSQPARASRVPVPVAVCLRVPAAHAVSARGAAARRHSVSVVAAVRSAAPVRVARHSRQAASAALALARRSASPGAVAGYSRAQRRRHSPVRCCDWPARLWRVAIPSSASIESEDSARVPALLMAPVFPSRAEAAPPAVLQAAHRAVASHRQRLARVQVCWCGGARGRWPGLGVLAKLARAVPAGRVRPLLQVLQSSAVAARRRSADCAIRCHHPAARNAARNCYRYRVIVQRVRPVARSRCGGRSPVRDGTHRC